MTPSDRKDSDSSDSRKTLVLGFDLLCRFFWIFSFFLFSPSVVVVDFVGNMKPN